MAIYVHKRKHRFETAADRFGMGTMCHVHEDCDSKEMQFSHLNSVRCHRLMQYDGKWQCLSVIEHELKPKEQKLASTDDCK